MTDITVVPHRSAFLTRELNARRNLCGRRFKIESGAAANTKRAPRWLLGRNDSFTGEGIDRGRDGHRDNRLAAWALKQKVDGALFRFE